MSNSTVTWADLAAELRALFRRFVRAHIAAPEPVPPPSDLAREVSGVTVVRQPHEWIDCTDCGFAYSVHPVVIPAILKWRPACSICAGRNHAMRSPLTHKETA